MSIQSCVFFLKEKRLNSIFSKYAHRQMAALVEVCTIHTASLKRIPEILLTASSRRRINGLSGISPKKKIPLSGKILDLALHVRAMVVSCECPAAGFLHVDNPAISDDRT